MSAMGWPRLALQAAVVGGLAGALAEVLVLRLNPEVPSQPTTVLLLAVPWITWGSLVIGAPLLLLLALAHRTARGSGTWDWWPLPELAAVTFTVAAALFSTNADLHTDFLSGSGHRTIGQDAVTWLIGALLSITAGVWVRHLRRPPPLRIALALFILALPLVRLASQPSPPRSPEERAPQPLGVAARPLLVVGLEGLDANLLLAYTVGGRYPALGRIVQSGAWGSLESHPPFLRRSMWTTIATGTPPRGHGVSSRWAYRLPGLAEPLRLLPWLPGGSRLILPWGLARREVPPPTLKPPLWERLQASGSEAAVFGWPGLWRELPPGADTPPIPAVSVLEAPDLEALRDTLAPFPAATPELWQALESDLGRTAGARAALGKGVPSVWLHLQTLTVARQELEPEDTLDAQAREAFGLVLEQVDDLLQSVLDGLPPDGLLAIVSPYGMEGPGAGERLLRLLGLGGAWRASTRSCPDGVLLLSGPGVAPSTRCFAAGPADVVPTLCYLLDLPVAQYMEGRVILEAIDPAYLARTPLRVVD